MDILLQITIILVCLFYGARKRRELLGGIGMSS
jgi:anaerobic C4-dicarboxylate transporter